MKNINEHNLWNQPDKGDPLVWFRKHQDANAKKNTTVEELSDYSVRIDDSSISPNGSVIPIAARTA